MDSYFFYRVQRTGHVLKAFGNFASRKYEDVRLVWIAENLQ